MLDTAEQHKIRVVVVTRALAKPWSVAFLPDGGMLVTELQKGQLRIIRNGVLDPQPIVGVPKSRALALGGLMDVVLHPRFAENKLIYLTYTGDRLPAWKGNVFVGGLRMGEIPGSGHLERIVFNEKGEELRRELMLIGLWQRIRDGIRARTGCCIC